MLADRHFFVYNVSILGFQAQSQTSFLFFFYYFLFTVFLTLYSVKFALSSSRRFYTSYFLFRITKEFSSKERTPPSPIPLRFCVKVVKFHPVESNSPFYSYPIPVSLRSWKLLVAGCCCLFHKGSSRPICLLKVWPPLYYNNYSKGVVKFLEDRSWRAPVVYSGKMVQNRTDAYMAEFTSSIKLRAKNDVKTTCLLWIKL